MSFPHVRQRAFRASVAALMVGGLLSGVTACAPEPEDVPDEIAGEPSKGASENLRSESLPEDVSAKNTEIPDSFPTDAIQIPEDAVIDDVGERDESNWYLVLRAPDAAQADVLWDTFIEENSLAPSEEMETGEGGRSATLVTSSYVISALTLPDADGTILLSYDIALATA